MPPSPFSTKLLKWYHKEARDLPWRRSQDPYRIWISEIMLQQTTVTAVIPYYEKWIQRFPDMNAVARARPQTILKMWQGLGYYQRARNIHAAAKRFVATTDGTIPRDPTVLREYPGFGPYTVAAVLSIAFDQRLALIDGNVRRVVMRLLARKGSATTQQDPVIYEFLEKTMPDSDLRSFNQAMMELGAVICRSREPLCSICPVKSLCRAYEQGIQELIPTPKKTVIKEIEVALGVLTKDKKILIQQRPAKGLFADLWEFPGGKVEPGETSREALIRELQEEVGVTVENVQPLLQTRHFYTQFRVQLHVFTCTVQETVKPSPRRRWVTLNELPRYPMPSGSARIVDALIKT